MDTIQDRPVRQRWLQYTTSQSVHDGYNKLTGQLGWLVWDGQLSRGLAGLRWGKVTERCAINYSLPFLSLVHCEVMFCTFPAFMNMWLRTLFAEVRQIFLRDNPTTRIPNKCYISSPFYTLTCLFLSRSPIYQRHPSQGLVTCYWLPSQWPQCHYENCPVAN